MSLTSPLNAVSSQRMSALYKTLALMILLIGLLQQVRCLNFHEVIDDSDLIHNADQRGWQDSPLDCFRRPVFQLYYRPLFTATFAIGHRLHSEQTIFYHAENLALHAAVVLLGFWFFYLLFRQERTALLAGLFFTLHPLQVTVTTFIGGRTDSLALLFLFLFAIGALKAFVPQERETSGQQPALGWLLLSLVGYAGAVFTKEQCIPLLLLFPLLLRVRGGPLPRSAWGWLSVYLVPILAYVLAARQIVPPNSVPNPHWSLGLHLEMIGRTLSYFERLLFLPTVGAMHQATLGPWDTPQTLTAGFGYAVAAVWLTLLWRLRANRPLSVLMLWTTLTVFPCLNFIPIPSQLASCYRGAIPLVGATGLLGSLFDTLLTLYVRKMLMERCIQGGVVVVILIYCGLTLKDMSNWKDNEALMRAEISGDPNYLPAHHGLAFLYEARGQWTRASEQFDRVLGGMLPKLPPGENFVKAVDSPASQRNLWSHSGLRYQPHMYASYLLPQRAWTRQQSGHFDAAVEDYRLAILLAPDNRNLKEGLRVCYLANGRMAEAHALDEQSGTDDLLPLSSPASSGH